MCAIDDKVAATSDKKGQRETFIIEVQESIQNAIDAAGPGGTIYLKEGIYKGTLNIDKSVNLIGAGSGRTIVDGGNKGSVFTIGKTNLDIDVKLAGMTIRGGSSEYGAGINNFGKLTVKDSSITGNNANKGDGGIHIIKAAMTLGNTSIANNCAESGAGILNDDGSRLVMNDVNIGWNIATIQGGGVWNNATMDFEGGCITMNKPDNIYYHLY